MLTNSLPEVCCRCHKLKLATLGKFFKSRHRFCRRYFICHECLGKPISRVRRKQHESFPEAQARQILESFGFHDVYSNYPLGPFIYDLAFPKLRLLIEIDSRRWHSSFERKQRDQRKTAYAKEQHWELVRVQAGRSLKGNILSVVQSRASKLS